MQLWEESASAGFAELLPPDHGLPEAYPERLRAILDDPQLSVFVAEDGGALVGYVGCGANRDPDAGPGTGEVRALFVAPSHWRRGVGRELMATALEDLRARRYEAATVWSFAANDRANAFYADQGFAPDGAERTEDAWGHIREVRYRRSLA
jgi:GNAT superfamily N-acetyltransferase